MELKEVIEYFGTKQTITSIKDTSTQSIISTLIDPGIDIKNKEQAFQDLKKTQAREKIQNAIYKSYILELFEEINTPETIYTQITNTLIKTLRTKQPNEGFRFLINCNRWYKLNQERIENIKKHIQGFLATGEIDYGYGTIDLFIENLTISQKSLELSCGFFNRINEDEVIPSLFISLKDEPHEDNLQTFAFPLDEGKTILFFEYLIKGIGQKPENYYSFIRTRK